MAVAVCSWVAASLDVTRRRRAANRTVYLFLNLLGAIQH